MVKGFWIVLTTGFVIVGLLVITAFLLVIICNTLTSIWYKLLEVCSLSFIAIVVVHVISVITTTIIILCLLPASYT